MTLPDSALSALSAARRAEREQALFYRALASTAEERGAAEAAERLNGLHADEQHQLSRLTARLLELGQELADLGSSAAPGAEWEAWEEVARAREKDEVQRYESLLRLPLDEATRSMIADFLRVEREHAVALGGKWMGA